MDKQIRIKEVIKMLEDDYKKAYSDWKEICELEDSRETYCNGRMSALEAAISKFKKLDNGLE